MLISIPVRIHLPTPTQKSGFASNITNSGEDYEIWFQNRRVQGLED